MKIGLLAGGALGIELLIVLNELHLVNFCMTDRGSESIQAFCQENQIACFIGNPRKGRSSEFIANQEIDVLVSINYLFLIEKDIIELPKIVAFNVHGSLLPKYRGRTPHVWAIINGESKTGITAHVIDEGCDTGNIIKQVEIPILKEDTGADVLTKYNANYPELVMEVLAEIENNTIHFKKQNNALATSFEKRTPEDGCINWNWHKERLYNWVRAQAHPYPGAFTYLNKAQFIIDKIEFSEFGYHQSIQNGTIVHIENGFPLVKTPNGVVKILSYRNQNIQFKINEQFTH